VGRTSNNDDCLLTCAEYNGLTFLSTVA